MPKKPTRIRKTPEQLEAERIAKRVTDLTAVGMQPEAAYLVAHSEVEVTRIAEEHGSKGKKAAHNVARRVDAFDALREGLEVGCYDAARRLERDILTRMGLVDRVVRFERVDSDRGVCLTDLMVSAGQRVDAVMAKLSDREALLFHELILPSPERTTWREQVAYITGETHTHAQGAVVRAALVNLRDAYRAMERRAAA